MRASPPVQRAAATTWTTSEASPSAFSVLAWPEKEGVSARPALSASVSAVSGRRSRPSEWRSASAVSASVAARADWMRITSPYRVSRTVVKRSHEKASASVNPPAAAPWSRMFASATSASAPAIAARMPYSRRRTRHSAVGRATTRTAEPPTARRSRASSKNRPAVKRTSTVCEVPVRELDRDRRPDTALEDVEHERPRDGIGVGRDSTPRHGVGAGCELGGDPDRHLVREGLRHVAVVHLLTLSVEHAQRAERRVHRLVELQQHLVRRLGDDHVVPGLRADEHRVRGGSRRERGGESEARPPE